MTHVSTDDCLRRVLYLCDWLPPDFGAVGQYSIHFARERAKNGQHVILSGLSSSHDSVEEETFPRGRLTIIRLRAPTYDRSRFVRRLCWTIKTNVRLLWHMRRALKSSDEIIFTGCPPFMLHILAPLNLLLRKCLVYRITDFHPECLMAAIPKVPLSLRLFYRLTVVWRRTVQRFEVLGIDQKRRLEEIGIPNDRIVLKRDLSPVQFNGNVEPLARPQELQDHAILLYSGNYGVAHDHETFVEGYRRHHKNGSGRVGLWLNATGAKADLVEHRIREMNLPIHRALPVPLEQLARLLVTPDAHLITLRDPFVGFVLPSKVYGCIESKRDVLYVGSHESDIHLLCRGNLPSNAFHHAAVGDVDAVAQALELIADHAEQHKGTTVAA